MGAPAKPVTDWFHQSMRIQHVEAVAQAFPEPNRSLAASRRSILRKIERMRHRLWPTFGTNGRANALSKAERALKGELKTYRGDPKTESWKARAKALRQSLKKLRDYVESPQTNLVDYAARHRAGERVGTSLAESGAEFIVNARMARSQHMRWSEHGAFNLLQVRTADINRTLKATIMAAWPPNFGKVPRSTR
ncbi:MAG: hypothetical protein AAGG47_22010, partial [Pseudomonadota bacterium]